MQRCMYGVCSIVQSISAADLSQQSPGTFSAVRPCAQLSARRHKQQTAFYISTGSTREREKKKKSPAKAGKLGH